MERKELDKAFEPYFTTKGLGQGTGLGLALVHAIVDEHDSFLDVHSKPGQGTHFYIYFPIVKPEKKDSILQAPKKQQTQGNETIMIVDDEESIRQTCGNYLQSLGYQVELFENGIEALKRFNVNSIKFDLIITDLTMPGLSGDKLAKEILKIQPEIPIILCTGYSEEVTESKAIQLGISKFVKKPLSNYDLSVIIREIFDNDSCV